MKNSRYHIPKALTKLFSKFSPKKTFKDLADPRRSGSMVWSLGYVLQTVFFGLCSGHKTLRAIEALSLNFSRHIPESTLRSLLPKVNPRNLEIAVEKVVKQSSREHVFARSARLPVKVCQIDGKRIATSRTKMNKYSQYQQPNRYEHLALRAFLGWSEKSVFLGQHMIPVDSSESQEVVPFIDKLINGYGKTKIFDTFSLDAGVCSKATLLYIVENGYNYVARIKGNKRLLRDFLKEKSKPILKRKPAAVKNESVNGKKVERVLYRLKDFDGLRNWDSVDIKEAWCVVQKTTEKKNGKKKTKTMVKYYVTNLDRRKLTSSSVLEVVQTHWSIENEGFFNLDSTFEEDKYPLTNAATEVVRLVRLLAFNIMQLYVSRTISGLKRKIGIREVFSVILINMKQFLDIEQKRCFQPPL